MIVIEENKGKSALADGWGAKEEGVGKNRIKEAGEDKKVVNKILTVFSLCGIQDIFASCIFVSMDYLKDFLLGTYYFSCTLISTG